MTDRKQLCAIGDRSFESAPDFRLRACVFKRNRIDLNAAMRQVQEWICVRRKFEIVNDRPLASLPLKPLSDNIKSVTRIEYESDLLRPRVDHGGKHFAGFLNGLEYPGIGFDPFECAPCLVFVDRIAHAKRERCHCGMVEID